MSNNKNFPTNISIEYQEANFFLMVSKKCQEKSYRQKTKEKSAISEKTCNVFAYNFFLKHFFAHFNGFGIRIKNLRF